MNCKSFTVRYLHRPLLTILLLIATGSGIAEALPSEQDNRKVIQLRHIGHELLLAAGDSTSIVLPVKEITEGAYQISFEKPFPFVPDSLLNITERIMKSKPLTAPYTLSVMKAGSPQIVYGFTSEDAAKGTVPCIGRNMPADSYIITIQLPGVIAASQQQQLYSLLVYGLLIIIAGSIGYLVYQKKRSPISVIPVQTDTTPGVAIGDYMYFPVKGKLTYGAETIALTAKEQTLLSIFARQLNQVIDRNLLLKEGWEDEGVITGRSLDMYVSKLRRKLGKDASINIKNVHGKGYSLTIADL